MHYAAAARDGGHHYKILLKAGADPKLTDSEGQTADHYLKNPGKLDLTVIKEKDMFDNHYGFERSNSELSGLSDLTEVTEGPESIFRSVQRTPALSEY